MPGNSPENSPKYFDSSNLGGNIQKLISVFFSIYTIVNALMILKSKDMELDQGNSSVANETKLYQDEVVMHKKFHGGLVYILPLSLALAFAFVVLCRDANKTLAEGEKAVINPRLYMMSKFNQIATNLSIVPGPEGLFLGFAISAAEMFFNMDSKGVVVMDHLLSLAAAGNTFTGVVKAYDGSADVKCQWFLSMLAMTVVTALSAVATHGMGSNSDYKALTYKKGVMRTLFGGWGKSLASIGDLSNAAFIFELAIQVYLATVDPKKLASSSTEKKGTIIGLLVMPILQLCLNAQKGDIKRVLTAPKSLFEKCSRRSEALNKVRLLADSDSRGSCLSRLFNASPPAQEGLSGFGTPVVKELNCL